MVIGAGGHSLPTFQYSGEGGTQGQSHPTFPGQGGGGARESSDGGPQSILGVIYMIVGGRKRERH